MIKPPPQASSKPKNLLEAMDTATLLKTLLDKKDPTWAQLNRIIRKKESVSSDFVLQEATLTEFQLPGKTKKAFTEEEKAVLGLESRVKADQEEIAALRRKIIEVEKDAFQKGLREGAKAGFANGKTEAKKEMDTRVAQLQDQVVRVIKTVESKRNEILEHAEGAINGLVLSLVRKIVSAESVLNENLIAGTVKNALQITGEGLHTVIRIHPDDAKKVKDELALWVGANRSVRQIAVEEDPRIARGGCVVETDAGQVDARLETQLAKLEELITRAHQEQASGNEKSV